MKELKLEQGSADWFEMRLARITASRFPKLMPTPRQKIDKWNDTQLSILREIAAQRLTGEWEESFTSKAMQWGIDNEDNARRALSAAIDMPIRESGFWVKDDYVGASPDGIIGFDEFLCELKCPSSKVHLKYSLDMDEWFKDYGWQLKSQLWITEIKEGYYASYDPRFPDNKMLSYSSYALTDEDIDILDNRIGLAVELIKEWTADEVIQVDF